MSFDATGVVARIADHLCDTAVRDGARCTWLGTTQEAEDGSDQVDFVYGTIGPELYGGGAGVALFLAEAARRSGSRRWRETALAGVAHALDRTDVIPPALRASFHLGVVGVAYAAAAIARALDHAETEARAAARAEALAGDIGGEIVTDPLSGGIGAIAPLLLLAERFDRPALGGLALELGRRTLAAAIRSDEGWSWSPAIEAARPLTGMSHGAAGIGWSLLELGAATGRSELIEAGHAAFAYETRCFRPAENNWPDFREDDDPPCCVAWCHGAPGIGLARLRAVELGFDRYRADAEVALRTTRAALADRDGWIDGDWSLCHGRAGLMEVLRYAGEEPLWEAAADAAERFGENLDEWPCGVRRGSNPSLMLGLAGVGYGYLGLADPTLSPILLTPARRV
jgi:lantibiotic biosynthesis protein